MTFNSRAVATVTVVFPESAPLPWHLHDNQSISFIIPSTLAERAGPRVGRAQWEPGSGLEVSVAEAPSHCPLLQARCPCQALEPAASVSPGLGSNFSSVRD